MGSDPGTNNVIVKWYADHLDRVDEISLFWVVSIAELAGAAWDHSLHMTIGKIPQYLDGKLEYVEGGTGEETARIPRAPRHVPGALRGASSAAHHTALHKRGEKGSDQGRIDTFLGGPAHQGAERDGLSQQGAISVKGTKVVPYDLTLQLWGTIPDNRDKGPLASGLEGDRQGREGGKTGDLYG